MTQDEIIEMAKKAYGPLTGTWWDMDVSALERFAILVAQKIQEDITKINKNYLYIAEGGDGIQRFYKHYTYIPPSFKVLGKIELENV